MVEAKRSTHLDSLCGIINYDVFILELLVITLIRWKSGLRIQRFASIKVEESWKGFSRLPQFDVRAIWRPHKELTLWRLFVVLLLFYEQSHIAKNLVYAWNVYSNINTWNQKRASLDTKFIQIGQAVKIGQRLDESGLENTLRSLALCTDLHNYYDNKSGEI